MKKKSILVGTVALGLVGTNLTSCNNVGDGNTVRDNAMDGNSEVAADDNDGMKNEDGSEKAIEARCGEDHDSSAMKSEEMLCGEGKCGEGMCGGHE